MILNGDKKELIEIFRKIIFRFFDNVLTCDDSDANHDMDCSGYCNGTSFVDNCSVCICDGITDGDTDFNLKFVLNIQ